MVLDKSLDAPVCLPDQLEERVSVVLPELGQLGGGWVLAAGQLEGDLLAAVPDVVVVLHAARQRVPGGTVGRAVRELGSTDLGKKQKSNQRVCLQ